MLNTISAKFCLMDNPFGDKIRDARLERGWSQRELARRIGKSATYVHYIEGGNNPSSGKKLNVSLEAVDELAKVLHLNKDDLRLAAGFAPENLERPKPQNVQELLSRLNELGVGANFFGGLESLPDDPETLAAILQDIETVLALRARRLPPNESNTRGVLPG
jgi:transcriptional regulator with XRE-family HTH domain